MAQKRSSFRMFMNTTPGATASSPVYVASTDVTVDASKTYYTESGGVYTAVASPTGDPSASGYYEAVTGPSYHIIGPGVTTLTINYNPQTTTEQFIHEETARTDITGYQVNAPVTGQAMKGDPVYDFINKMRRTLPTMDGAYTDVVLVDLYETPTGSVYPESIRQNVSIQIDTYGGAASDPLSIGYTINWQGDGVHGNFDVASKEFTPSP